MSEEKRYDLKAGFQGCLVSLMCQVVLGLSISLVLNNWLGLISNETERVLTLFIWLFAICLGGYVAARLGKTTGWTNSLVVGVLAEFFVFTRLPKGEPDQPFRTSLDPFLDIVKDPGAHWRLLLLLGLTIPVAILGGVIWAKTSGVHSSGKEESKDVSKGERSAE